jgi:SAM-dependent methyltransferase
MARDLERRRLFDTVADLYDELRPSYPAQLVDDVVAISGLTPGGRILEIGAGTGQATRLFAERGFRLTSLELGANLAARARRNLEEFPNATVLNVPFEEWPLEEGAFQVAISGSAFHWIPAEVGFSRCARALTPEGSLALFWNGDPRPSGGIYQAVQDVYERLVPEMTRRHSPNRSDEAHGERIEAFSVSGLFDAPVVKEYAWSRLLTAEEYARLICTYSDHIALPEDRRAALCEGICAAIDKHGGMFEHHYLTRLYVARRL